MSHQSYDIARINLLEKLATHLSDVSTPEYCLPTNFPAESETAKNLYFMEAYFTNVIEGIDFDVDDARDIVFNGSAINSRFDDTRDLLNTYVIVSDADEMSRLPKTEADLLELLKHRHMALMHHRSWVNPGAFKARPNRAADTFFVMPEFVEGTLARAFQFYKYLRTPLSRAIFMHTLVCEVHPFADGNGRLSRIMMNSELASAGEPRIIITSALRDEYMAALRSFSKAGTVEALPRMLLRAQAFTVSMDCGDYAAAKKSFIGAARR